jgi:hypothetical protein
MNLLCQKRYLSAERFTYAYPTNTGYFTRDMVGNGSLVFEFLLTAGDADLSYTKPS